MNIGTRTYDPEIERKENEKKMEITEMHIHTLMHTHIHTHAYTQVQMAEALEYDDCISAER